MNVGFSVPIPSTVLVITRRIVRVNVFHLPLTIQRSLF